MSRRVPVSVIIVAWNCLPDLLNCLRSIRASTAQPEEIIVIDNASIDGTSARLPTVFPDIRLVCNEANLGHTRAVNYAMSLSTTPYILVLDPDTELRPDAIERMADFLESRRDISMVAPRTLNTDGTIQETARQLPTAMSGLFGRQSLLTQIWPDNPLSRRYLAREHLHSNQPFAVEQIGGAAMFFRRELVDEVGYWDEAYFAYWVDTDWCLKVTRAKKSIYCLPAAVITHHESNARGKKRSPHRIWLFHRGALRLYRHWYTYGTFDPRLWFAASALLSRAGLQIVVNAFRPAHKQAEKANTVPTTTN